MSLPASFLTSQNKSIVQGQGWVCMADTILFCKRGMGTLSFSLGLKVLYLFSLFLQSISHNAMP